jgi:hypothetical protein
MTVDEIDNVIRALNAVADNLDTRVAKQSIREAFLQVRAHTMRRRATSDRQRR